MPNDKKKQIVQEPQTDDVIEDILSILQNMQRVPQFHIASFFRGLRILTSMAARFNYGKKKVEDYDTLAARHDYLVIQLESAQKEIESMKKNIAS